MKLLITGAAGMLAHALIAECGTRGHDVIALSRSQLDVERAADVNAALEEMRPDVVIQCAAYTKVDDAEREPARALAVNAAGTAIVAAACAVVGARLVYPSTDYVFDGTASQPYTPDAPTAPQSVYGATKLAGEEAARAADALIVRTSWLYGAGGRSFVRTMLERGRAGQPLRVVDDQRGAPTWTGELARMIIELIEQEAPAGIYHATNAGDTTWFELARAIFETAGIPADVQPVTSEEYPQPARRPRYSVLDCSDTYAITGAAPHWRESLGAALSLDAALSRGV